MLERGHVIHEAYDWNAIPENAPVISFCNEDFLAALPEIRQRTLSTLNALWFTHWDPTEPVATAYDYTPYGAVTATGIDQLFQWSSEVYDAELGVVYYNYRHYNPLDGRWIGRDLLQEEEGVNLYVFIKNIPLNQIDLLGNSLIALLTAGAFFAWFACAMDAFYKATQFTNNDKLRHCHAPCQKIVAKFLL